MTRIGRPLIAVALAFFGWSGWSFWQAGTQEAGGFARERDLVLSTGRQQVAALNTMDWTRADEGLRRWLDASTGPLHDRLRSESQTNRSKILKERTSAVATVVDAAVITLDVRAGSAQLIASLRIDLTPRRGTPTVQRKRYEAGLSRTPGGWRLKSLTVIPVGVR